LSVKRLFFPTPYLKTSSTSPLLFNFESLSVFSFAVTATSPTPTLIRDLVDSDNFIYIWLSLPVDVRTLWQLLLEADSGLSAQGEVLPMPKVPKLENGNWKHLLIFSTTSR
jgi:hypothetical protein